MLTKITLKTHHYFNTIFPSLRGNISVITFILLYLYIGQLHRISAQSKIEHPQWVQFVKSSYLDENKPNSVHETYLLLFQENVRLTELKRAGIEIYRQISKQAVIVSASSVSLSKTFAKAELSPKIYETNNLWKLSPSLFNNKAAESIASGNFWLKVNSVEQFKSFVAFNKNIQLKLERGQYFLIKGENIVLSTLIGQSFIVYVGKEATQPKPEATVLDLNLHPNRINALHHYFPELNGADQTLSLKEPFYDTTDIDLAGRYVESGLESEFTGSHPLQMATIAVGAGNSFITGRGVAAKSSHTSSDNSEVVPDLPPDYERLNVQVQNHSYGTSIESFYGTMAALFDESTTVNQELLHIFSSGNSGNLSSTEGKYAGISGFANLTGNFKQAKNILTVGSVDTTGLPILLSSKGPAYDGRVKPEMVTYSMAGTSNSAALVSGTAILLQQAYKEQTSGPMSAALLKGYLINSADDVHNKGVDYSTGYGQLNALRAVENLQNEQHFTGTINQAGEQQFLLNIPADAKNLKITLIWNDPPANPNDAKALINDLDLTIINEAAQVFLPMVLNTEANSDALREIASTGEDHLNNIEQVLLETAPTGEYQIKVKGFDISVPDQKYYLLYQWDEKDHFRWTSPTGSDNIPYNGETTSHLRWESSFDETEGTLSYQLLKGQNAGEWIPIDPNVPLKTENYRWPVPEEVNNLAVLKMSIASEDFLSDTFSISPSLRLGLGFDCGDSILLRWDKMEHVTQYQIKTLINNELTPIATTVDTALVLRPEEVNSDFFQVTPLIGNKALLQSFTIDYKLQGAGCYINTFFVDAVQDSGVFLQLELGIVSGIEEIYFERLNNTDEWEAIYSTVPDQTTYRILDAMPSDGFNFYRVQLKFANQNKLSSDSLSAYFVKTKDFVVYPNPLRNDEALKVFSRKFEGNYIFQLTNIRGEVLTEFQLTEERSFIELPKLADGLYLYHIYKDNKIAASGKLLYLE